MEMWRCVCEVEYLGVILLTESDGIVRVFTIRSISRLPAVRFAIARLRNHLEIVRPLWLVVYRDVYEHCSCKQCVLIVFEYHGQQHVCCLLILVYKYTFIESTNNDRSVEVIHGRACRKYHGITDIQGAETGKVCRCDTTFEGPISYSWCTSETLGETEKVQTDGSSCIR